MAGAGPRAVVFDFFGTLTPATPAEVWLENSARVAEALDVPTEDVQRAFDETFDDRAVGALGDLTATMRALAERLGAGVDADRLAAACRARREVQLGLFRPRPEALDVLAGLRRRGLRVGLVSDCTAELVEAWPELPFAQHVDAPLFSCVEGRTKPDPRLYADVADRLEVPPAACLYVGDGGSDELAGAAAAGMTPVLLAAPDHGASRRAAEWSGRRIGSLSEIPALLDRLAAAPARTGTGGAP